MSASLPAREPQIIDESLEPIESNTSVIEDSPVITQNRNRADKTSVPAMLDRLSERVARYLPPSECAVIEHVIAFVTKETAERPQIMVASASMGEILADMHIDVTGITAGMLHHLAIDPETSQIIPAMTERIGDEFGADVAYLIESIVHFTSIVERRKTRAADRAARAEEEHTDRRTRARNDQARRIQVEAIRKMFVAMGDDPRIVVFKLADQLRQMRDGQLPIELRRALAEEARDIYAPLAGRLGMSRIESEMEDGAFAQLEPEEYRRVANLVNQVRAEQKGYIDRVCAVLVAEAAKVHIVAEVSGRYKHLWSIYRKLIRNGWDIRQVYDLIAFRILVPNVPDCYAMLGQVHALWPPKEDRIKDFIAHQKSNGYQSLHTTVFCLDNHLAEIQIRTHEMHQNAEYGVAMHWYYKDAGDSARLDKRLNSWLLQLQDWQSDIQQRTSGADFVESGKEDIGTRSQVFVFTPQGDVKDLPSGSTPVDFAYRIHSSLGDRCAGARIMTPGSSVPQKLVPLDYRLENGQIVEIITRRDAHPRRDWLNFVRTHAARNHINRWLKLHERDIYVIVGRERFDREARLALLGSIENIGEEALKIAAEKFTYNTVDEMFAAIGGDTLRPSQVIQEVSAYLKSVAPPVPVEETTKPVAPALPGADIVLNLAGAGGLLAHLANCCHPLPGDPVAGYISRGRGIVIHHTRCRSLKRLREREENGRIIAANWDEMRMERYEASIIVIAHDRQGLLRDVTQQIQEMKINLGSVSTTTNRKEVATIMLTMQINSAKQFEEAVNRIKLVRGVQSVSRDTRNLLPED